ncbi:hypothetical protein [Streptomyces sp. NPDC059176]|uniref:hypothetical protein n=1 Tax=unclassified Streptomyces TaxID=2593676 RepID=UPI003691584A
MRARPLTSYGIDGVRASASADADDVARVAAHDLNTFAAEARAGRVAPELTIGDRLALTDTSCIGGDAELDERPGGRW